MPKAKPTRPLTPEVVVRLEKKLVRPYQSALVHLRRELGAEAPSLDDLLRHEFSHRPVKVIVDDFLAASFRRIPRPPGKAVRIFRDGRPFRAE